MHYIKLPIPVKTYVRKYIEKEYPGPIKLGFKNTLGYYLYVVLEKQSSHWHRKHETLLQKRYSLLTDHFIVQLPANSDTFYKTGFSLPISKAILINDYFEDQIIKEINFRANTYCRVGFSRNQAIEDFCEEYNIIIDVDITHGALKKAEYRYRKYKAQLSPRESQMPTMLFKEKATR